MSIKCLSKRKRLPIPVVQYSTKQCITLVVHLTARVHCWMLLHTAASIWQLMFLQRLVSTSRRLANLPNRYSALCWTPVTHVQTWASYSALYWFGRLSRRFTPLESLYFWSNLVRRCQYKKKRRILNIDVHRTLNNKIFSICRSRFTPAM